MPSWYDEELQAAKDFVHTLESKTTREAVDAIESLAKEIGRVVIVNGHQFVQIEISGEDMSALVDPLRKLAKAGYHQPKDPCQYECGGRWCVSTVNESMPNPFRQLNLYLTLTGTKCKIVHVGVDVRDKYEVRCEQ